MATERITIVVQERGTRIVNRRLKQTADAASVATKAIQLMRRALVIFASAVLLRRLFQLVDAFTQLSNRLRLVTTGMSELRSVTEAVLDISNRTRTAFDANAEVFTRVALSVREIGASQGDTLTFLENLNKAIIVSGATATEASAGIIQLTQGLASDRLSGDELRSVLEQLPRVAQLIADSMEVGRGKLRELGEEGQLTGKVLFDAILNATEELDEEFSQVEKTIGQSFTVLRNNLIAVVGDVNRLIPLSQALSTSILILANSLRALAFGALATGIVAVSLSFNLLLARAKGLSRVLDVLLIRSLVRLRVSFKGMNASMVKSIALSHRLGRTGLLPLTTAFAAVGKAISTLNRVLLTNISITNTATAATAIYAGTLNVLKVSARKASVAVLFLNKTIKANPFVFIAAAIVGVVAFLFKFRREIKLGGSGLATLGDLAKVAFDNIKESLRFIKKTVEDLFPAFDNIKKTVEDLFPAVNLSLEGLLNFIGIVIRDAVLLVGLAVDAVSGTFVGLYQGIVAVFTSLPDVLGDLFFQALNESIGGFEEFLNKLINSTNKVGELLRQPIETLVNFMIVGFNGAGNTIAGAINFITTSINTVIDNAVIGMNVLIRGVNKVAKFLGRSGLDELGSSPIDKVEFEDIGPVSLKPDDLTIDPADIDRLTNPFEGAGSDAATAFTDAFTEGMASQHHAMDAALALLDQANNNALQRQREASKERAAQLLADILAREKSFQDQFNLINQEIELLRKGSEEREYQNHLNKIKNDLIEEGIDLTADESVELLKQLEARLRQLKIVEAVAAALDEVRGISLNLVAVQAELNAQVALGLITVEQSTRAYVMLSDAVAESQVTKKKVIDEAVEGINKEIALLRLSGSIRNETDQAQQAAASVTNTLREAGILLDKAEAAALNEKLLLQQQQLTLLTQVAGALEEVQGVTIDLAGAKEELQQRIDDETISVQEATEAYRELRIAQLEGQKDGSSGAERGLLKYQRQIEDVASSVESAMTGAFKGMEDALVDFVTKGEINFASFANSIISDMVRIAVQQAIIGPLLGSATGAPFTAAAISGARALGGPVSGGQPYLVGERGPEIFTPPTGGGSIEPNSGQGGGNVRIINVVDPSATGDFLASADGERIVLNHITRNPNTVRQAAGG